MKSESLFSFLLLVCFSSVALADISSFFSLKTDNSPNKEGMALKVGPDNDNGNNFSRYLGTTGRGRGKGYKPKLSKRGSGGSSSSRGKGKGVFKSRSSSSGSAGSSGSSSSKVSSGSSSSEDGSYQEDDLSFFMKYQELEFSTDPTVMTSIVTMNGLVVDLETDTTSDPEVLGEWRGFCTFTGFAYALCTFELYFVTGKETDEDVGAGGLNIRGTIATDEQHGVGVVTGTTFDLSHIDSGSLKFEKDSFRDGITVYANIFSTA